MKLPFIRPATMKDLEALIYFSHSAGYGITSLPQNRALLKKKIEASEHSFSTSERLSQDTYLFCLEWEEQVIGVSGIVSHIGISEPFYAYHILKEPSTCHSLNIHRNIPMLYFTQARKSPTEIGTLFLSPSHRHQHFGTLLSYCRFLFIATFRERFAPIVIAELRGVNNEGDSPFWNAIGRHFYHIDFPQAHTLRAEHLACIGELFPKHPIYIDLLPQEAQEVIGKVHPETLPAQHLLERQGFHMSHYIDIFDSGPHLYALVDQIHAIETSQDVVLREMRSEMKGHPLAVISNNALDFRATVAPILIENRRAIIHPHVASALKIDIGDTLRYYPM